MVDSSLVPRRSTKFESESEPCRSEKNRNKNFVERLVTFSRAGVGKGSCDIDSSFYTLSISLGVLELT